MDCPKCNNTQTIKDGFMSKKQRYLCKTCNYHFTSPTLVRGKPLELRRLALHLYLEGLGFNSIGRLLQVSDVCVLNWIRKFGEGITELQNSNKIEIMELDELHTYVGSKKTLSGFGLLSIDLERNTSTLGLETEALIREKSSGSK